MQVYLHLLSHHLKEDKRLFLKLLNYSFKCRRFTVGVIILTRVLVFAEQQSSVVAAFSGLLYRSGRRPTKKNRITLDLKALQLLHFLNKGGFHGTYHCPSPPSFSPFSPGISASSLVWGSLTTMVLLALQTAVGAGGSGGSLVVSSATGKASTVRGGTVETGELHSVLEPLRRASR